MGSVNKDLLMNIYVFEYVLTPNTSWKPVFCINNCSNTMKFVQMMLTKEGEDNKKIECGKTCADYSVWGIQLNNKLWLWPYYSAYNSQKLWWSFDSPSFDVTLNTNFAFWIQQKMIFFFFIDVMDWEREKKQKKTNEWMMENVEWVANRK